MVDNGFGSVLNHGPNIVDHVPNKESRYFVDVFLYMEGSKN